MKNKGTAILLCLFFGGLGIHHFYLGEGKRGLLFLLFCWTFIPVIISFFQFFGLCFMNSDKFNRIYNHQFIAKGA